MKPNNLFTIVENSNEYKFKILYKKVNDENFLFSSNPVYIEYLSSDKLNKEIIKKLSNKFNEENDSIRLVCKPYTFMNYNDLETDNVISKNDELIFEIKTNKDAIFSILRLNPSFRYGDMTPWGGNNLKKLYNKNIPSENTGESLELSGLKGLESKIFNKYTISELSKKYGKNFIGSKYLNKNFPLLLKILDANEKLSIQVHPDNDYASKHENGKYGKEEAWIILSCKNNSKLIYGLKENVNKEKLIEAINSNNLPSVVNYENVNIGDVFHIKPGTVHALTEGIMLYEIQQSSDITYRLWDWNRLDSFGNKRELHINKATDCIKYGKTLEKKSIYKNDNPIIDSEYFLVDYYDTMSNITINKPISTFMVITFLKDSKININSNIIKFNKGESAFVPANIKSFTICKGTKVLISTAK